jgi:hypothetical protein
MRTTITAPVPTSARLPSPPVRLALTATRVLPGRPSVDGVWWPRSRDLSRELPALTDALEAGWGHVVRVTVDPTDWPVVPRTVRVTGRRVRVGCFPGGQPYELILLSHTAGRCELLVVPPEAPGAAAAWPAPATAAAGDLRAAGVLMARQAAARAVAERRRDRGRTAVREASPLPRPAGPRHPAQRR